MKNLVQTLLVTIMIFLYASSFGQSQGSGSTATKPTYIDFFISGVNTNLNYGKLNNSLKDYKKDAQGVQVGVSAQIGVSHDFSLVPELAFGMKGGKLKVNNPLTNDESILRFYAVEIPVLARFHLGKFHLNAGPSIAYNFYGTQKVDGTTTDLSFENSTGGYKRFDAGIQAGGGLSFRIKQKRAVLDIRYCYGLTNVSYDREIYNRSLIVRLHMSNR